MALMAFIEPGPFPIPKKLSLSRNRPESQNNQMLVSLPAAFSACQKVGVFNEEILRERIIRINLNKTAVSQVEADGGWNGVCDSSEGGDGSILCEKIFKVSLFRPRLEETKFYCSSGLGECAVHS